MRFYAGFRCGHRLIGSFATGPDYKIISQDRLSRLGDFLSEKNQVGDVNA